MQKTRTGLKTLDVGSSVRTDATHWEFVGSEGAPAWLNKETKHRLIVDTSNSEEGYVSVKLNHKTQADPWWTIVQIDTAFIAELLPLVEWFISSPDRRLWNEYDAVRIPERLLKEGSIAERGRVA